MEERQLADPLAGLLDDAAQKGRQVAREPADRDAVEEVVGVLQVARRLAGRGRKREREIELRGCGLQAFQTEGQAGDLEVRQRRLVQGEGHLEER